MNYLSSDEATHELRCAILERLVEDYIDSNLRIWLYEDILKRDRVNQKDLDDAHNMLDEVNGFFKSKWCDTLLADLITLERLMKECDKRIEERKQKILEDGMFNKKLKL